MSWQPASWARNLWESGLLQIPVTGMQWERASPSACYPPPCTSVLRAADAATAATCPLHPQPKKLRPPPGFENFPGSYLTGPFPWAQNAGTTPVPPPPIMPPQVEAVEACIMQPTTKKRRKPPGFESSKEAGNNEACRRQPGLGDAMRHCKDKGLLGQSGRASANGNANCKAAGNACQGVYAGPSFSQRGAWRQENGCMQEI